MADLDTLYDDTPILADVFTNAPGAEGSLPLTEDMLLNAPSGDLFALSQNVGMGWDPAEIGRTQVLILSTQGGIRAPDGASWLEVRLVPAPPIGHAFSTKLSITRFSPAFSKATVSLLPSTAATFP